MMYKESWLFPDLASMEFSQKQQYLQDMKLKKVKTMSYMDWFWFHPTAHSLVHFSTTSLGIVLFLVLSGLMHLWGTWFFIIPLVFVAVLIKQLYQKIKNYQYIKNITFYERLVKQGE